MLELSLKVATVLTVYGIETCIRIFSIGESTLFLLQQYLPFTVLKLFSFVCLKKIEPEIVATVLTVYGIETYHKFSFYFSPFKNCCNSTYRLRY